MKWLQEFKAFAVRGNVVDMAVGIVIGAAFGKIVSSVVADVIMPPIGLLIGGVNFSKLVITLKAATPAIEAIGEKAAVAAKAAVTINYGNFIQTIIDFVIIAFAIFMVVKGINSLKRKEAAKPSAPPTPSAEVVLLTDIRNILQKSS
ncbi:MAG: large-conductance mechanosensitive channel protein MscL [Sedimentisphaerales bacterium]|nr:large-conductance mechanosensitive channel protein MscL [Sedimentisphaerales bacterium]